MKLLLPNSKWIHIIGIAGQVSAPLAIELSRLGYHITGSDQEKIYPPASLQLKQSNIAVNLPLSDIKADFVIVGNSYSGFKRGLVEYQYFINKVYCLSLSKFIARFLVRKNSILIAGSHGKSTITAPLVWIFHGCNRQPSFLFGSPIIGKTQNLSLKKSSWSIVEADESIHGLDKKAKFFYYPKKYLIISSTHLEHRDIYHSRKENDLAYLNLVRALPATGLLVLNKNDRLCQKLKAISPCPVLLYNQRPLTYQTKLPGYYNQENIDAAFTLASRFRLPPSKIINLIKTFPGISRRMEYLGKAGGIHFWDDFAQEGNRISSALATLKEKYPTSRIFCFFEAHASFLSYKSALKNFNMVFSPAHRVILGSLVYSKSTPKKNRSTFSDYKKELGKKLIYLPQETEQFRYFADKLKDNDVFIHFSSGGQSGLEMVNKIYQHFKKYSLN